MESPDSVVIFGKVVVPVIQISAALVSKAAVIPSVEVATLSHLEVEVL